MKKRILLFLIVAFLYQNVLSQVSFEVDIDAQKFTQMKLSDISAQNSFFVSLNISSILVTEIAGSYLFVSKLEALYQFDLSGKLIRTFSNNNRVFRGFSSDSRNNRLIILYDNEIEVRDFNATFLKNILLPVPETIVGAKYRSSSRIIGFEENNVWIFQEFEQNGRSVCRICRLNIEDELMEIVLERDFPIFDFGSGVYLGYMAWYSSFGGKYYMGFHDNVIYEVDGKNVRPVVKYNIRNYREDIYDRLRLQINFTGRYFNLNYGTIGNRRKYFWFDVNDKQTWQVEGGIEDDIFHTGTLSTYSIQGEYLVFRKQERDLPIEMNVEKDHTVIFIIELKQ